MANTITPNMNLIVPGVGSEAGPTYATDINSSLTIIDGHSHVAGSGVQITPAAININAALTFNNFSITNLSYLTLTPNAGTIPNDSVYTSGVDLYFKDGSGNSVQMTSGGLVNATSSGIASGTASASFIAGVLVVNAASTTPANIQGASILIGNNIANSKFLTLAPPTAMAANFSITLPNVSPLGVQLLTIDTSGNIGQNVATAISGSSANAIAAAMTATGADAIASVMDATGANAIGVVMTATGANAVANSRTRDTTSPTATVGNVAISASSGSFVNPSPGPNAVTNLSVVITTSGRPVFIGLISDGTTGSSEPKGSTIGGGGFFDIYIIRNGTTLSALSTQVAADSGFTRLWLPPTAFSHIDPVAAGTWTYSVSVFVGSTVVTNVKLIAYEL